MTTLNFDHWDLAERLNQFRKQGQLKIRWFPTGNEELELICIMMERLTTTPDRSGDLTLYIRKKTEE